MWDAPLPHPRLNFNAAFLFAAKRNAAQRKGSFGVILKGIFPYVPLQHKLASVTSLLPISKSEVLRGSDRSAASYGCAMICICQLSPFGLRLTWPGFSPKLFGLFTNSSSSAIKGATTFMSIARSLSNDSFHSTRKNILKCSFPWQTDNATD